MYVVFVCVAVFVSFTFFFLMETIFARRVSCRWVVKSVRSFFVGRRLTTTLASVYIDGMNAIYLIFFRRKVSCVFIHRLRFSSFHFVLFFGELLELLFSALHDWLRTQNAFDA